MFVRVLMVKGERGRRDKGKVRQSGREEGLNEELKEQVIERERI